MKTTSEHPTIPGQLVRALREAKRVTALTGSGISAESGIPTFREAQTGLWARYDPLELATPEAFSRNPELVWDWYHWRQELIRAAAPNPGHLALVELERSIPIFKLITQNVDGLHRSAGSQSVIELHGNINRVRCVKESTSYEYPGPPAGQLPGCPNCGGLLRPDVVWFGESLPQAAMAQALSACHTCEIFISIGTSSVVQPAASLAIEARQRGATILEINTQETPLTGIADFVLRGPSGVFLPSLVEKAFSGKTWANRRKNISPNP